MKKKIVNDSQYYEADVSSIFFKEIQTLKAFQKAKLGILPKDNTWHLRVKYYIMKETRKIEIIPNLLNLYNKLHLHIIKNIPKIDILKICILIRK